MSHSFRLTSPDGHRAKRSSGSVAESQNWPEALTGRPGTAGAHMQEATSIRVRCSGHTHTISLTSSGALALRDHPQGAVVDRALVALGGETCRCLEVLSAWRQGDRRALPAGLRPAMDARETLRARRTYLHSISSPDPLQIYPVRVRTTARVEMAAKAELDRCAYRRSQTHWAGGEHTCSVRIGTEPTISGSGERVWSRNGKWPGTDSHVSATIPLSWFSRIYRRGLAVVGGAFILDILAEDEKGVTVLAGRQGRGFEVYPAHARIITEAGGTLRLRWTKEAK